MTIEEISHALEEIGFEWLPANWCERLYESDGTCIELVATPGGFGRMLCYVYADDPDDAPPNLYRHHIPKDRLNVISTAEHWRLLDTQEQGGEQ